MGHTINPISNRLKINQYWKSNWCSYTNYNYKYLLFADFYFLKFISWFINMKTFDKLNIVLSFWSIAYTNNSFFFSFHFYRLLDQNKNNIKILLKIGLPFINDLR
jgi:hypothetical protein